MRSMESRNVCCLVSLPSKRFNASSRMSDTAFKAPIKRMKKLSLFLDLQKRMISRDQTTASRLDLLAHFLFDFDLSHSYVPTTNYSLSLSYSNNASTTGDESL